MSEANNNVSIINIGQEMRQSYMDYAMSVIIGRALPDVRDGLKPVQRRVFYAMHSEGLVSTKKTSKCAGVVGEVLKKFHPHGDSSVYDALVHLVQPWAKRMPLIDGQGNFGSIDGDSPAAYRYTECRLSPLGEALLTDIEQQTVDFTPNFDDSTLEPLVLPAIWPNLLVNGADGIAVGMATHIPPHNLAEVVDATVALLANPDIPFEELAKHIPGPDFPTGGVISGTGQIMAAYRTGKGILRVSAKTHIETLKRKTKEVEAIIATEIPYQVNKKRLIEKIAELVNDKKIEGISNLRDESDRAGMRIVIELKRDATAEVVLNQLLKLTPLRSSFGVINLSIVDGRPQICTLRQMLSYFIDHRRSVIARRTLFQLNNAEKRLHVLQGFLVALANLDQIIDLIKKSDSPTIAKDNLIARYQISAIQAQAILDLRLQKLTGMERLAIEREHADLVAEIARLQGILADPKKVDAIIQTELLMAKEKYGEPRRTVIEESEGDDFVLEDLIENVEMAVTLSNKGYIKRTNLDNYRAQKRGGKGVGGVSSSDDDDFTEHFFIAETHNYLLIFTSSGRLYWLKVYEVPEAGRTAKGRNLINLLELKDQEEKITAVLPVKQFAEDQYVVMATDQGAIKRIELSSFSNPRKGGIVACTLKEDEKLVSVELSKNGDDILMSAASGKAIRFNSDDVRDMGRTARGVRGIKIETNDRLIALKVLSTDADQSKCNTLLTVCENGYGKRTMLSEYRQQGRGGKGVIDIQTDERNGQVVGIAVVSDDCEVMLMTSGGKVIRMPVKDVSVVGRNTKGVRMVSLESGEKVLALASLAEAAESSEEVVANE